MDRHAFKLWRDDVVPETMRLVCAKKKVTFCEFERDTRLSKLCLNVGTSSVILRKLKVQCANILRLLIYT